MLARRGAFPWRANAVQMKIARFSILGLHDRDVARSSDVNHLTLIVCRLIVVTFPRWRGPESRPANRIRKARPPAAHRAQAFAGEARGARGIASELRGRDRARRTERRADQHREASPRIECQARQTLGNRSLVCLSPKSGRMKRLGFFLLSPPLLKQ
jgi:hypothetical protein